MGKQIVDWSSVDWSKRDIEISREVGVSRERVRQMRPQEARVARSYAFTVERATPRITPVVDWSAQDWRQTNKEIAASIGCAIARVKNERKSPHLKASQNLVQMPMLIQSVKGLSKMRS